MGLALTVAGVLFRVVQYRSESLFCQHLGSAICGHAHHWRCMPGKMAAWNHSACLSLSLSNTGIASFIATYSKVTLTLGITIDTV